MIKWLVLATSFSLFFGYLGVVAFIFVLIFYLLLKIMKEDENIQTQEQNDEKAILELDEIIKNESLRTFDANELETYKEIIYTGTQNEKIELIGMVVFNPSREYVGLIRQLLNDEDETVRILASNSLQKMENYFENKIETLKESIKLLTNTKEKTQTYLKLVETYDSFIESTLLESFITPEYEEKIFKIFDKISKLNDSNAKKSFLQMSVKYNRYVEIIDELKNRIQTNNSIDDKFLLAEIYYKQNQIDMIKEVLKDIEKTELKNMKLKNSYEYWVEYAS